MAGSESREFRDLPLIQQPYENVDEAQVDDYASTIMDFLPVVVKDKLQLVKLLSLQVCQNLFNV